MGVSVPSGATLVVGPRNNYAASAAPGVSNDATQGYGTGSVWVIPSLGVAWICITAAAGAAVWRPLSGVVPMGTQVSPVSKTDADTNEATLGSITIPAGVIRSGDMLRSEVDVDMSAVAVNRTIRIRAAGTELWNSSALAGGTVAGLRLPVITRFVGVASQRTVTSTGTGVGALAASNINVTTVDFSTAVTLTLTGQWGTAGSGSNSITARFWGVELVRAP